MLAVTVRTEKGERYARVSAHRLGELVRRIGGAGDRFLIVERIPDRPDVFVQVWHGDEPGYTLEHRDGAADRHFQADVAGPEQVLAAMTGWAREQAGWDGGLRWARLDLAPAAEPASPLELGDEERESLVERVRTALVGGYSTRADLAELAEEYLVSDGRRPVSPEQARQLAERMWADRLAEQAGWQGETDPERISRAFEALESAGITAVENFTCCRSCGLAEIDDESLPGARGFVFFHSQCTDSAVSGRGLTLLYGGFDGSSRTTAAVGREVVAALGEVGLAVEWDGDPGRALTVTPLEWRKRIAA